MLGSNPSADSVASTDAGGCYGIPLSPSAYRNPHRERHQSVKSWGCGGKAPACGAGTQASSDVRALSHNAWPRRYRLNIQALRCWNLSG